MKGTFNNVASAMKTARNNSRLKLSQTELAFQMGWHPQFVSNIERAQCSLPSKNIVKVCEILGVPYETFTEAIIKDFINTLRAEVWTVPVESEVAV
jgi:transcriptional regulator with XRE-family HTH domain